MAASRRSRSDRRVETHGFSLPGALIDALIEKQCVLFTGGQFTGGYPTRHELARAMIKERTPGYVIESLDSDDGDPDVVFDVLWSQVPREQVVAEIHSRLTSLTFSDAASVHVASAGVSEPVNIAIARLPFQGCITMTIDPFVEDIFRSRQSTTMDGSRISDVDTIFAPDTFVIARLNGSVAAPETLRLTTEELRRFAYTNPLFSKAIASMLAPSTVLFFETTAREIVDVLSALPDLADVLQQTAPHVLYVSDKFQASRRDLLRLERYKIEVIEGKQGDGAGFIAALLAATRSAAPQANAEPAGPAEPVAEHVRTLTLTDIGPLRTAVIPFSTGWNVILGNNGAGKSTILRAIALALCGDAQASAFAGRKLLRAGRRSGTIDLELDNVTHTTGLGELPDRSVHVASRLVSPVQQGTWAVLGFPPMRGARTDRVRQPSGAAGWTPGGRPRVEDLLPLLAGSFDTRLDDLREWIVALESLPQGPAMRNSFFSIMQDVFADTTLAFASIEPTTKNVLVRTADGVVPIDQLSQGMISLLAWVGILIQRMYEIYPTSSDPTKRAALVLVDEIDAHLHPEWQRLLVPTITKHFPNLQIIATTHSPLVVTSLARDSILIARRDENGDVVVLRPAEDVQGRQAEWVYTSDVFGMPTTRPVRTVEKLNRYSVLLNAMNRTPEEETEMSKLSAELFPVFETAVPSWQTDAEDEELAELENLLENPDARERVDAYLKKNAADSRGVAR